MEEKLRLSNSGINSFLHCRKAYYFSYIADLKPKGNPMPLMVGSVIHKLLHLWYVKQLPTATVEDLEGFVKELYPDIEEIDLNNVAYEAAMLFGGYINEYKNDPLTIISSEFVAEHELEHCVLSGVVDAIAKDENNKLWRVEHKTAKRTDASYLNGLKNGLQGAIYDYLIGKLFNDTVAGSINNILVKTKIPKFIRAYNIINLRLQEQMLKTVDGVSRDILLCKERDEWYPSCQCFVYFKECQWRTLCNHDSPEIRENFYEPRGKRHLQVTK